MNLRLSILAFLGLLSLCSAALPGIADPNAWVNVLLGGKAVTLTVGNPRFLKVEDVRVSDDTQLWKFENGYFVSKAVPTYVFDVYNGVAAEGARVIGYTKKNPPAKNQQFSVLADGRIASAFGYYYLSVRADGTVIITKKAGFFTFQLPPVGPFTCTSWGDPHFVRFDGSAYDFYGVGDYILAEFGQNQIQARQYICNGGVSCNEKLAIRPAGYNKTIIITDDTVTVGGQSWTDSFVQLTAKVSITRSSRGVFRVQLEGGYVDSISYGWHHTYYVTITGGVLAHAGLCQLKPRNGSTPANQHEFGLSWIVMDAIESLFDYDTKPFEEVNQPDYPPNYGPYTTDDPVLLAAAAEACSQLVVGEPTTVTTTTVTYTATRKNTTVVTTTVLETALLAGECDALLGNSTAKHHKSCVDDVIATGRVSAAQPAVAAYATLCYQAALKAGVTVVLPTVGGSSKASGSGLDTQIVLGGACTFTIWAVDAVGRAVKRGGDVFTVTSVPPRIFTIVDNNDGSYTVSYNPTLIGSYEISVKHNGIDHIVGSPFNVIVIGGATFAPHNPYARK